MNRPSVDMPVGFEFSTDSERMDRDRIHKWLSQEAYWALNRSIEAQNSAMDGSRNYGIFRDNGEQVAFARVVTDSVTFAWICDVFVDKSVRGSGIGKALVASVCAELESFMITKTILATEDAHDLYRRFGFKMLAAPDNWMLKLT